jgi:hypothetical protein
MNMNKRILSFEDINNYEIIVEKLKNLTNNNYEIVEDLDNDVLLFTITRIKLNDINPNFIDTNPDIIISSYVGNILIGENVYLSAIDMNNYKFLNAHSLSIQYNNNINKIKITDKMTMLHLQNCRALKEVENGNNNFLNSATFENLPNLSSFIGFSNTIVRNLRIVNIEFNPFNVFKNIEWSLDVYKIKDNILFNEIINSSVQNNRSQISKLKLKTDFDKIDNIQYFLNDDNFNRYVEICKDDSLNILYANLVSKKDLTYYDMQSTLDSIENISKYILDSLKKSDIKKYLTNNLPVYEELNDIQKYWIVRKTKDIFEIIEDKAIKPDNRIDENIYLDIKDMI